MRSLLLKMAAMAETIKVTWAILFKRPTGDVEDYDIPPQETLPPLEGEQKSEHL